MPSPPPIVLHLPHASTVIPESIRSQFSLNDTELDQELGFITDHFTDELFQTPASVATTIPFQVSRIVVDPERFEDDAQEPMSQRGMGAVYTLTTQQTTLRNPLANEERTRLLSPSPCEADRCC